mmetsp:Transcript_6997/g.16991  ORF Transcript_6997/g.16991 Transcript_6997/m.16991 type:complete len:104 (+) Transcript_6997:292-603(+)
MGIFGNLFGPDPLASVWEHLHRANVGLANAHHTSRNVPHTGDLAQAIRHGAEAERLGQKRATLEENQRLKVFGPLKEVNDESVQSPAILPVESQMAYLEMRAS